MGLNWHPCLEFSLTAVERKTIFIEVDFELKLKDLATQQELSLAVFPAADG